jgi:hypothetical protein
MNIKIYEREDDGWYWNEEMSPLGEPGILERHKFIWSNMMDSLFSDSAYSQRWDKADLRERKFILKELFDLELHRIREDFKTDINDAVEIVPFVPNPLTLNWGKFCKEIEAKDYEDIEGMKAEISEEIYDEQLNVLPPLYWKKDTFYCCEFLTGSLTTKFWKESERYYCQVVDFKKIVPLKVYNELR